jgi:hypothetical protein
MSIRFITDSQRVKVLRSLHRDGLPAKQPLTSESIEFLLAYIETLETELERTTVAPFTDTISSLAEQIPTIWRVELPASGLQVTTSDNK